MLVITASVRSFVDLLQVFETSNDLGEFSWLLWFVVAITVIPAVICVLKGKLVTAALGIVYQPIGFVGAFRLAKPESFWARHLYGPQSRRRARSERRFGDAYDARWDRVRDLVGGAPTAPDPDRRTPDRRTVGTPTVAPDPPTGSTRRPRCPMAATDRKAPEDPGRRPPRRPGLSPCTGTGSRSAGTKVSLIVRGDTHRSRFRIEPALSLVPLPRAPPNGCCPTTAPVGLSLM